MTHNTRCNPFVDLQPKTVAELLDFADTLIDAIEIYGATDDEIPAVAQ